MIDLEVIGIKGLEQALKGTSKQLPRELMIAVNATAKKVRTGMGRQVREELTVKAKDLKPILKVRKKANRSQISALVRLDKTKRLSLKAFGVRQTRAGVSFKISKRTGRKTVRGGFMGPKPGRPAARLGGHAYIRRGPARYPIVRMHGASPGGAYEKQNMRPRTINDGATELAKQVQRRVRFNTLKKQGLI
jgi:hypothetical protein